MKNLRVSHPLVLVAAVSAALFGGAKSNAANLYWDGVNNGLWSLNTNWSTASGATSPDPANSPALTGTASSPDTAIFNISTVTGGTTALLGGNQSALGLQFITTSGTAALRASAAGQILTLGTSGITYGSSQVDIGGSGTAAMVVSLAGSQAFTGSSTNLIQFNVNSTPTTQTITNGTAGAVTLTFNGAGTGGRTVIGAIDDGTLGGTTALTVFTTGTSGAVNLNGTNLYTGGTTFTQGFLGVNSATALGGGAGALTINGAALSSTVLRTISTSVVGGVTLVNNNPQAWNADFTLGGGQSINFGTGAVALGSNRTIIQNPGTTGTTATNYTEGGNISGTGFGLTVTNFPVGFLGYTPGINSQLNLTGTNSYTGGTTITSGLVRFGSAASIPTTGQVNLNGGALSVSGAFTTLASVAANPRVTRTAGALALVADSSENFTPNNGNISLGAALGTVVNYTGTITTSGNNYNLGGGGGTIIFSNTNAFTGAKSITTNGGSQTNTNGGGGTVIITGLNNNTGNGGTGVNVGAGTLEVSSIGSLNGPATNLGTFTSATNGTLNFGGSGAFSQLRYTGAGETTDRILNFAGFSGANASFDASGTGALAFSTTTFNQASTAGKSLILRGINTGANSIAAGIGTSGTNNGANSLTKQQRGAWTLSGSNNISGLTINGGTLTADYTSVATVFTTSTPNLTLGGGALVIKGNAAGTTTQTLGNLTTSGNAGQNQITVIGNGSPSTANLTLGNTVTRAGNTYVNFNLLNGGTVTTAATLTSGLITSGLAGFTVTDSAGTDFATITGGQVAKLGSPDGALPTSGGSGTANYSLSGNVTLTANVAANTTRIDTSAGSGTLTLSTFNITGGQGELLMSGANDYTISGSSIRAANGTTGLSNYGPGKLTVAANATTGTGGLNKTGPGLVELSVAQTYTGSTNILGGVLRVSSTIGTGNISLNTGGIYEIGSATIFSRQLGTGASQVQWANGDGGFSAFGGDRTVTLTNTLGTANGQLAWGSSGGNNLTTAPNVSTTFVRDGFALLLGASTSNATVDFTNPIDFVNVPRTVEVGNGSAAVDARLSGILSSSDYSGGLYKTGTGTLEVTAANTYTGQTSVLSGTLLVRNTTGSGTGTGTVRVNGTGTLGGTGIIAGATSIAAGGTITGGTIDGVGKLTTGALTLTDASSIISLQIAGTGVAGTNYDQISSTGAITYGGASLIVAEIGAFDITTTNGSYNLLTGAFTGDLGAVQVDGTSLTLTSGVWSGTSGATSFTYTQSSGILDVTAVPEPSTWVGAGLITGLAAWSQRKRLGKLVA